MEIIFDLPINGKRVEIRAADKPALMATIATTKFQPGQEVTTSGLAGVVVRMYSCYMVEVRLAAGMVCVPVHDVKLA